MSTAAPRGVGNGEVLAIAGVVAGAVGGVVMAVIRSREDRRQPSSRIVQLTERARAQAASQGARQVATEGVARARAAVQAGLPVAVAGGQQLGQRARQEAQRASIVLGERAREAQSALSAQLEKREDVADRASSIVDDLSKRSRKGAKTLRAQSGTYAAEGLKRARDAGESASEVVHQLVPELRGRVEKQVVPKLHDISEEATDRGHDLYDVARERASALRRTAEKDVLPTVSDLTTQAREVVAATTHRLGDEAAEVGERLTDASSVAAERATEIGRKAQHGTKQAADATVQGGRDLSSTLIWLAIGGAVIYYALLDDHQREQAKRLAQTLFSEAREIYQDIQGRDEEFT